MNYEHNEFEKDLQRGSVFWQNIVRPFIHKRDNYKCNECGFWHITSQPEKKK